MTDITQIHELEYDAILRQAVAVIDRTRAMVATVVCSAMVQLIVPQEELKKVAVFGKGLSFCTDTENDLTQG